MRKNITVKKTIKRVNFKTLNKEAKKKKFFNIVSWTRAYKKCPKHKAVFKEYLKKGNML